MTKEKGKLLEMNHEETFQAPSLVFIKEGGTLTCFPKRIQLLFKGLTPQANILNDREKEILPVSSFCTEWCFFKSKIF